MEIFWKLLFLYLSCNLRRYTHAFPALFPGKASKNAFIPAFFRALSFSAQKKIAVDSMRFIPKPAKKPSNRDFYLKNRDSMHFFEYVLLD